MMIIPYRLETTFTRLPLTNLILVAVTSMVFFFVWFGVIPIDVVEAMVLRDWDLGQMIGCLFLHGGLIHLLGNMLFLWIFGNAVCAAVGNVQFGFIYLFLGIVASTSHLAVQWGSCNRSERRYQRHCRNVARYLPCKQIELLLFFFASHCRHVLEVWDICGKSVLDDIVLVDLRHSGSSFRRRQHRILGASWRVWCWDAYCVFTPSF